MSNNTIVTEKGNLLIVFEDESLSKFEKSGFGQSLKGPQDWPPRLFKLEKVVVSEGVEVPVYETPTSL